MNQEEQTQQNQDAQFGLNIEQTIREYLGVIAIRLLAIEQQVQEEEIAHLCSWSPGKHYRRRAGAWFRMWSRMDNQTCCSKI